MTIEQLLPRRGLRVGATISPHVAGWAERIRVDGGRRTSRRPSRASGPRPRSRARRSSRSLTAAALAAFADAGVDVAVVEAGLGGRLRRDERPRAPRRRCSRTSALEHTDVLGDTLEAIATEKLAVAQPRRDRRPARTTDVRARSSARRDDRASAAPARRPRRSSAHAIAAPTRRRAARPARARASGEIRDGAHNPTVRAGSLEQLAARRLHRRRVDPRRQGRRRDARARSRAVGARFVATASSNPRALPADELASSRRAHFDARRGRRRPGRGARARAHELGEPRARDRLAVSPRAISAAERVACSMAQASRERLTVLRVRGARRRRDRRDRVRRRVHRRQAPALTLAVLRRRTTVAGLDDFFDSDTGRRPQPRRSFFVVVFWLATAYWVYKDARRRIEDPWLVAMATLLGLVPPFLGPIIYMFFRPPEYIEDVRERELEIKAMEERLAERDLRCPVCRAEVEPSFLVCPVCTTRLKQACADVRRAARGALAGVPVLRDARRPRRAAGRPGDAQRRRASLQRRLEQRAAESDVDSAAAWPSRRTLVLVKPDGDAPRPRRRDRRALRAPRPRAARRAAAQDPEALAQRALRRAQGQAVLRRARRLHHLRRRRSRSPSSGESAISVVRTMMGATNPADSAPGTIRGDFATSSSRRTSSTARTRRRARSASSRCSSPTASSEPASSRRERNREDWTTANAEYTDAPARARLGARGDHLGRLRRARGRRSSALGDVDGLDVVELGCGTAYVSAWLARRGARPVGVDVTPAQLETARRCQAETGSSSRSSRRAPRTCRCPTRASTSRSRSTARASGATRTAGSRRRSAAAAGRAARRSSRNSTLSILCAPDEGPTRRSTLLRPQRGMRAARVAGRGRRRVPARRTASSFRLLRRTASRSSDLVELYAPDDAVDHEYYDASRPSGRRKWPIEEIWVASEAA